MGKSDGNDDDDDNDNDDDKDNDHNFHAVRYQSCPCFFNFH